MSSGNVSEPPQKKARRELFPLPTATTTGYNEAVLSSREFDINKRSEAFSQKINALYAEFPEMELIIPLKEIQEERGDAVKFYKEDIEAKERYHMNEMNSPLYALPDEVLQKCIGFIGEGNYALVALVSKKVHNAHEKEFDNDERSYTSYDAATASVETAKYCNEKFCDSLDEKDKLFIAAAVKGNIDILQYSAESGYDFFPFINVEYDDDDDDDDDDNPSNIHGTSEIVARGNLHVLKYLKDQFESYSWLQKYCFPAVQYGQMEILEWLKSIGCLKEMDIFGSRKSDFCTCAIRNGKLDVLKWLYNLGFEEYVPNLRYAIESKSIDMIQYCGKKEQLMNGWVIDNALATARNVEVYQYFLSLNYGVNMDSFDVKNPNDFEIIKFLRSVGAEWNDGEFSIMPSIVSKGTLEMIKYAHEDGCPWASHDFKNDYCEYYQVMWPLMNNYCSEKLKYLIDNGCEFDYDGTDRAYNIIDACCKLRDLSALECLVGKYKKFDNRLLLELLESYYSHHEYIPNQDKPWIEGIKYVFKKGKEISYKTIESVFDKLPNMELVKYLRECLHFPWTSNDMNKHVLLSEIAYYHKVDGVKWALDNGLCHENPSINNYNHNSDSTNNVCNLIIEKGFIFSSKSEKRQVIENAFKQSHGRSRNLRDSIALLQKIPVRSVIA